MALTLRRVLGLAVLLAAAGCPKAVILPVANAGSNVKVNTGSVVRLDGSSSCGQGAAATTCTDPQGRPLIFTWSFVSMPSGSAAQLNDPHSVTPSFIADVPGDYVAQLVVANSFLASAPATVRVTVDTCGSNVPTTGSLSSSPASPGVGQVVLLSANAHDADNDSGCALSQALSYSWRMISQPASSTATLNNAGAVTPSFTPDVPGDYSFRLVVTDSTSRPSAPSDFTLTASLCGFNRPVIPGLSSNGSLSVGSNVQLLSGPIVDADNSAACGSTSGGLGVTFSYAWQVLSLPQGSHAALNSSTSNSPSFVPDIAGTYGFSLIVTSSNGRASDPKTISLAVGACGGQFPVATINTQTPAAPVIGSTIQLSAIASDPDTSCTPSLPQPLTYAWALAATPIGSQAILNNPTSTNPSFVADVSGTYTVQLAVTDPQGHRTLASALSFFVSNCGASAPIIDKANTGGTYAPAQTVIGTAKHHTTVTVSTPVLAPDNDSAGCGLHETLSYSWSMTTRPPGSNAVIANPTVTGVTTLTDGTSTASAQFDADVPNATYQLQLIATASNGKTGAPRFFNVTTDVCGSQAPSVTGSASTLTGVFNIGVPVTLQATPTDPDNNTSGTPLCKLGQALAVTWTVVSRPATSGAALATPSPGAAASYTTTFTPDAVGTYQFSVAATDDTGLSSAPAFVSFTTTSCGTAAPVARVNGLADASVVVAPLTALNGSGKPAAIATSTDADTGGTCLISDPATYLWSIVTRPSASKAIITDPTNPTLTYTPDAAGDYTLQVVATDSTGLTSAPAFLNVHVTSCGLIAPVVNAVTIASASGSTVLGATLTASIPTTYTPSTGGTAPGFNDNNCLSTGISSYAWSLVTRPAASGSVLLNPASATPTFVPDATGTYQVSVVITDSQGFSSAPFFQNVSVGDCSSASNMGFNNPAVGVSWVDPDPSHAIYQANLNAGAQVTLSANVNDTNGSSCGALSTLPYAYQWALVSTPAGSRAQLTTPNGPTPGFVPDVPGDYQVSIIVTDALGKSTPTQFWKISTSSCGHNRPVIQSISNQPASSINSFTPNQMMAVVADADNDVTQCPARLAGTLTSSWSIAAQTAGGKASLSTASGTSTIFEAFTQGGYDVLFASAAANGLSSSQTVHFDVLACGSNAPSISGVTTNVGGTATAGALSGGAAGTRPKVGETVNLLATAFDPDIGTNACGITGDTTGQNISSFTWSVVNPPPGSGVSVTPGQITQAVLPGLTSTFTFTPDVAGSFVFAVTATDSTGLTSAPAQVTVTTATCSPALVGLQYSIPGTPNPSTMLIGVAATVSPLATVTDNCVNPATLTYRWTLSSKPAMSAVTLPSGSNASPTASVSLVPDVPGQYQVTLVVSDQGGFSSAAVVQTIQAVTCGAQAPTVTTPLTVTDSTGGPGVGQINIGDVVTVAVPSIVDGGTGNPNPLCVTGQVQPYSYSWALISVPGGSRAQISSATAVSPSLKPDVPGTYVVSVTVTDALGNASAAAFVSMQTSNCGANLPLPYVKTGNQIVAADPAIPGAVLTAGGGVNNTLTAVHSNAPVALTALAYDADADTAACPAQFNTPAISFSDAWTITSRTSGAASSITNTLGTTTAFTPQNAGTSKVALSLTSSHGFHGPSLELPITSTACGASVPLITGTTTLQNTLAVSRPLVGSTSTFDVTISAASADADTDGTTSGCGTALTPSTHTFHWTLVSAPGGADPAQLPSTFTGSTVTFRPTVAGTYVYAVTVTYAATGLTSQPVQVIVPTGSCGPNLTAIIATSTGSGAGASAVGFEVDLSTTPSAPSSACVAGATLTYAWSLLSKPAGSGAAFVNTSGLPGGGTPPKFTPDVPGTYQVQLALTDSGGFSTLQTTTINIGNCSSAPTFKSAGFAAGNPGLINWTASNPAGTASVSNGQINRGDRVQLSVPAGNINASTCDTANGATYTYQWTLIGKPAGSTATLSSTTDAQPVFIPDAANGAYKFLVTVNDSLGNSVSLASSQIVGTRKDNLTLVGTSDCGTRQPTAPAFTLTSSPAGHGATPNAFESVALTASTLNADPEQSASANFNACDARFFNSAYSYAWSASPSTGVTLGAQAATTTFVSSVPGATTVSLVVAGNIDGVASAASANLITVQTCGSNPPVATNFTATQTYLDAASTAFPAAWTANTAYPAGDTVVKGGEQYAVATPGTSGATGPSGTGTGIVDGSVTWNAVAPFSASAANNVPVQVNTTVTDADTSCAGNVPVQTSVIAWTLTPPPSSHATLSNANTVSPSFTPDVQGTYTLSETSTDGQGNSNSRGFSIATNGCGTISPTIANPINAQQTVGATPVVYNDPAVSGFGTGTVVDLEAGLAIQLGATVADVNAAASCAHNVATTSYSWSFISLPPGSAATMLGATTTAARFVPDVRGSYVVQLATRDSFGHSSLSSPFVIAATCGAAMPTAVDTASNGAVEARQTVTLANGAVSITQSSSLSLPAALPFPSGVHNGQAFYQGVPVQLVIASTADSDGTPACAAFGTPAISYNWSLTKLPSGSRAQLNSSSAQNPSFTPDVNGAYDVTLRLTDSLGKSSSTPYTFNAGVCGGQGPVAAIAWSQGGSPSPASLNSGVQVLLDGTSADPDKTPRTAIDTGNGANGCGLPLSLSYSWAFTSVPAGATPTLSNANIVNPAFTPVQLGSYGLSLVISDGRSTSHANVTLTVDKQWIAKNNASGPSTSTLTVNRLRVDSTSSHVWAGTNLGIWESLNGGTSWVQPPGAPTTGNFTGATIAYRTSGAPIVYASTGLGCSLPLFARFDGTSWFTVGGGLCNPNAIAADPTDPTGQTVVVGYQNGPLAVAVSTNGLTTLTNSLNNGLGTDNQIGSVAVASNGAVLIGSAGLGANGGRIYRLPSVATVLANGTNPWVKVLDLNPASTAGGSITALYADAATGAVLASVGDGSVYQSLDYGLSWALRLAAGPAAAKDVYLDTLGNGFAAVGQSLFLSRNNGASWSSISSGLPAATIDSVAFDPARPGAGYAGTAGLGFFGTLTYGP